ncbi:MAG: glycosyltransferase [Flavobacterium sp.]|nr:glycosyltransferase [Flavobacterium sp.]
MKILQIINSLATGGAEKLLLESIPIYAEQGMDVHLLLLNGSSHPFLEELKAKKCCTIHSLGTGSVYNPMHIFKIKKILKQFDVVHVHIFPSLYWSAFAKILSFSKMKMVYTEHSTSNKRRDNFILKRVDKLVYSQYNKIVAITPQVLENLQNHLHFKDENRFEIIANGLNLTKIKKAIPYSKADFFDDENAKIVIQVARFFEPKDHKTVIRALTHLPENVKLLLVGDGNLKAESEALVNELKLQKRVQFLGVRTDVLALLKTADIIVLSSKHEGLSLSCIEGMASGKPFVASDVPGLKDVVENAGILFPLGDEKALADIISKLLSEDDYYKQTVVNCQQKANAFDIYKMVDLYINIYRNL